jgi:hypothetical protein
MDAPHGDRGIPLARSRVRPRPVRRARAPAGAAGSAGLVLTSAAAAPAHRSQCSTSIAAARAGVGAWPRPSSPTLAARRAPAPVHRSGARPQPLGRAPSLTEGWYATCAYGADAGRRERVARKPCRQRQFGDREPPELAIELRARGAHAV